MRLLIPFLTTLCLSSAVSVAGWAQTPSSLENELIAAYQSGDTHKALEIANTLYKTSKKAKNHTATGEAAFTIAQIYTLKNEPLQAAKSYEACEKHYIKAKKLARSLECKYRSDLAYISAVKKSAT